MSRKNKHHKGRVSQRELRAEAKLRAEYPNAWLAEEAPIEVVDAYDANDNDDEEWEEEDWDEWEYGDSGGMPAVSLKMN